MTHKTVIMLLNKKFSKIEHYWLNDFEFRNLIRKNCYCCACGKNISTLYPDIGISNYAKQFSPLQNGLVDDYNHSKSYSLAEKDFYSFGWKLNKEGKVVELCRQKPRASMIGNIQFETEKTKLYEDQKLNLNKNKICSFLYGLSGGYQIIGPFILDRTFFAAGYDFYWRKQNAEL